MMQFRAAQRQSWKKKTDCDKELAKEAFQLVENFFSASQDQSGIRSRNNYVTQQYLDYCKKHGYSGLRLYFDPNEALLYQDFRIVDTEQVNRKKFYVYCEQDDDRLSQYRFLVVLTDEGWKIDKRERMLDGMWRFWPLE